MDENKQVWTALIVIVVAQILMFFSIFYQIKTLDSQTEILFERMSRNDRRQIEVIKALNIEVESWFLEKPNLQNSFDGMASAMSLQFINGNLTEFNNCIEQFNNSDFVITHPHITDHKYVDGYVITMFDKNYAEPSVILTVTEEYSVYSSSLCGTFYYNVTAKEGILYEKLDE